MFLVYPRVPQEFLATWARAQSHRSTKEDKFVRSWNFSTLLLRDPKLVPETLAAVFFHEGGMFPSQVSSSKGAVGVRVRATWIAACWHDRTGAWLRKHLLQIWEVKVTHISALQIGTNVCPQGQILVHHGSRNGKWVRSRRDESCLQNLWSQFSDFAWWTVTFGKFRNWTPNSQDAFHGMASSQIWPVLWGQTRCVPW